MYVIKRKNRCLVKNIDRWSQKIATNLTKGVRLKLSHKLLLIEAKAIGVRIDAFKRIKECREKFDDWKQTFGNNVIVGVILSGFIPENELNSLTEEGILVFWEHKENDLYEYLCKN